MSNLLYYTGLILVIVYILMGFDDFVWDIIILFKTLMGHRGNIELNLEDVDAEPKRLLAVMIAAWHEENVIEDVLNHFIQASIYPKSQFHIFVGVYPNDLPTIEAVKRASLKHHNVHVVINEKNGPTTKAQNLNYVLKQIIKFEKTKGWHFKSFTVHDSEDVIHSFELPYTNYIMTKYKAVQFPVFPLIEYPTLKNFFKNITSNTYADEFAEHHYLTMVYRNSVGAFVPSAGTGFALRRDLIEKFDDYSFLPEDSLTEDYKLAYSLYQKGENLRYVRAEVPYIDQKLKVKTNYVATRSMFPNTFETAVRQKRRWITGITMQSVAFKDIFKRNGLSFVGRYSLYRDQKAKVGNLIAFIGYPVLIYFVASLFIDLPPIYPKYSLSWYLSLLVTIMMIERLIFRTLSITKVYGFKSAIFSTMFPPLIPIRYVWGNTINFAATVQAYTQRFKKQGKDNKKKTSKNLKWDKTEHHFLSEYVLRRFYMRVGDLLLKRGYIEKKTLRKALKQQKETADLNYLGIYLLNKQLIQERHLLQVLADIDKSVFLEIKDFGPLLSHYYLQKFQVEDIKEVKAIPFYKFDNTILMAQSYAVDAKEKSRFEQKYPQFKFHWHYAFMSSIRKALTSIENNSILQKNIIQNQLLDAGFIDEIQFLLALNHSVNKKVSMDEAFKVLGLK